MTPYRNLSGNSNVASYEATEESCYVASKIGRYRNYLYNSVRPGQEVVERMNALAAQGYGLNSYISSTARDR
jgi:hypothetical protein